MVPCKQRRSSISARPPTFLSRSNFADISNSADSVKPFFLFFLMFSSFSKHTSPFTPRSGLSCSVKRCFDDHGSFRNLPVGFSPTQTSLRSYFDQDYLFELPFEGAGCPFKWTMFYFTPCPRPSCPTYEPNSNDDEYSHPFRHIQYKRAPRRRPIATFAMLLCRRIARWM